MRIFGLCWLGAVTLVALSGPALAAGDAAKGKAASVADYASMYSPGMKKLGEQGWVWTPENIDKWIADPKALIPDSPMALAFQGIPDAGERADIIAYLQTQTGQ